MNYDDLINDIVKSIKYKRYNLSEHLQLNPSNDKTEFEAKFDEIFSEDAVSMVKVIGHSKGDEKPSTVSSAYRQTIDQYAVRGKAKKSHEQDLTIQKILKNQEKLLNKNVDNKNVDNKNIAGNADQADQADQANQANQANQMTSNVNSESLSNHNRKCQKCKKKLFAGVKHECKPLYDDDILSSERYKNYIANMYDLSKIMPDRSYDTKRGGPGFVQGEPSPGRSF